MSCSSELFSILGKVTIGVLADGFIDSGNHRLTQFTWNAFDTFRTGPRTTSILLVQGAPDWLFTIAYCVSEERSISAYE